MKRPIKGSRGGGKIKPIQLSFTTAQLAGIGAVAMAYNEAEGALHWLAGACMNYPSSYSEVTSRISGTEGLIAIILIAVKGLALEEIKSTFETTLRAFTEQKKLRDAVIHSHLFDYASAIGEAPGSKGGKASEVLLTETTLSVLYNRLLWVDQELRELGLIVADARILKRVPVPTDQERGRLSQAIQDANARCLDHQRQRRSLPPFPKFPARL